MVIRKSQIIEMIKGIAIEITESKVAVNDERKTLQEKISEQDGFDFSSLSTKEIEYVTSILYFSYKYSTEQIDGCIDFLLEQQCQ